jgi:hypothetical protein
MIFVWYILISHVIFYFSTQPPFDFPQGLEVTSSKNFGGGNTAWEEEKLAKYARR